MNRFVDFRGVRCSKTRRLRLSAGRVATRRLVLERLEGRALLAGILLQTTFDNPTAIQSPAIGAGGDTTLVAADFVAAHSGSGAHFQSAGQFARFPSATGSLQNVEFDRGEIEFWYRPDFAPSDDDVIHALVTIGDVYGAPRISVTESDALHLTIVSPDWTVRDVQSPWHAPLWQTGQWIQIRAAWDTSRKEESLQLFVDGQRVDLGGAAGPWNMGPESSAPSIFVGAADGTGAFVANGIIDELTIRDAVSPPADPPPVDPPPKDPPPKDPPPGPVGPGVSDPNAVLVPARLPKQPAGVPFVDPVFGTTLVRVSDASDQGGFETHLYSQLQAFSADNAYLLLADSNGYFVRRMSDFSRVQGLDTSSWNAPRWHPTQPHQLVHFDSNDDNDVTLQFTNVDTGVTTDIVTFPAEYRYVRGNQSFDELSDDGRWLAGMATRWDGESVVFSLNLELLRIEAAIPVSSLFAGPCAPDPAWGTFEPDWVGVSPLGKYLMLQWTRDGTARCSGLESFDIQSGAFVGRVYDGHQHGDLGVQPDGTTEFFMTFELAAPSPDNGRPAIAIRELPGNSTASSPHFLQVLDWGNAEHISCRGPNGTCVVTAGALPENGWNPFETEVFIQRTDGTVSRLTHHRSSSCGYWVQPRASISRDGRYVVFASDWAQETGVAGCSGGNEFGKGDPYLIDLQSTIVDPANQPPLLAALDDRSVEEGSPLTFTALATDPDGDVLTYSLDPDAPEGANIGRTTGVFTWTPAPSQSPGTYTITIRAHDDGTPQLSDTESLVVTVTSLPRANISDVSVTEGNAGTVDAVFRVSLSAASQHAALLAYQTEPGTAVADADFSARNGTLVIAAGQTSATIRIPVHGDLMDEPTETFIVRLMSAEHARIMDGEGQGTITDDDPRPSIYVGNVSIPEGNSGITTATFLVTLLAPSGFRVTVQYATANGSARAGSDYVASQGMVSFNPGETSKTIAISVKGDTIRETDEAFYVALKQPTFATLANRRATGLIIDDDYPSLAQLSLSGSNAGATARPQASKQVTASSPIPANVAAKSVAATTSDSLMHNFRPMFPRPLAKFVDLFFATETCFVV